jgi:hypothetical protein
MHDVVATFVHAEMTHDASTELERRCDPPSSADVEVASRPDCDYVHAWDVWLRTSIPLAKSEVGDLVAFLRETLCECPVPALGATNGVWIQAVVDEADVHVLEANCEE